MADKARVPDQTLLPQHSCKDAFKILLLAVTGLWVLALIGLLIQYAASRQGFMPTVEAAKERPSALDATLAPKFSREIFSIAAADGQIIDVTWHISKKAGARTQLPTVVYFHGRNGHNSDKISSVPVILSNLYPYLGGAKALPNFNTIEINYRGTTSTSKTNWTCSQEAVLDGDAVIQFLRSRGVSFANMRLLGYSMGGGVATEMARLYPLIPKLCIINSFRSLDRVVASQLPYIPCIAFQKVHGSFQNPVWKYFFGVIFGAVAFGLGLGVANHGALFLGINWLFSKVGINFLGWNFESSKTLKKMHREGRDFLVLDHPSDRVLRDGRLGKSKELCRGGKVHSFRDQPVYDEQPNAARDQCHVFDFGTALVNVHGSGGSRPGAQMIGDHFEIDMPAAAAPPPPPVMRGVGMRTKAARLVGL